MSSFKDIPSEVCFITFKALTKADIRSLLCTSKAMRALVSSFQQESICKCGLIIYNIDYSLIQPNWCCMRGGYIKNICVYCGHYKDCFCGVIATSNISEYKSELSFEF